MSLSDFEELDLTVLNMTSLGWTAPLISADFGGGYQAGAISAPYGLHRWTLSADLIPDLDEHSIDYEVDGDDFTDPRFTYLFGFVKRHLLLGNKPFIVTDPRTDLKFLVSFAGKEFSFNQITAKIFAGGAEIVERRVGGLVFNGNGSIDETGGAVNRVSTIVACGFACGVMGLTAPHWYNSTSGLSTGTSVERSGHSLRAHATGVHEQAISNIAVTNRNVGRVYVYFDELPSIDSYIVWAPPTLSNSQILGVGFRVSDSKLYCATNRDAMSFGATGIAVVTGQWYRVDFKFDGTAGSKTINAQINGVALAQKTVAGSENTVDVRLGFFGTDNLSSLTGDAYFSDFILSSTLADYPIGAGQVKAFIPVSDGAHNTGTAGNFKSGASGANITDATTDSYLLTDELPLDDATPDTNDYINAAADTGGSANYVEHVFGTADAFDPGNPPRSVEAVVAYHQAATGPGTCAFKLNDGGEEDTVVSISGAGQTTTRYARKHYSKMPTDNGEWLLARFEDLRIRFGYSSDGNPDQYYDGALIEAEFAEE